MTAMRPLPRTPVQAIALPVSSTARPSRRGRPGSPLTALSVAVATISNRMRLNLFAHRDSPEPSQPAATPPPAATPGQVPQAQAKPTKTYPADLVVWGFVVRNGYDELDDPWYHRGVTQHAYLEGDDSVALCGFRPPVTGPRDRRRARLGLPSPADHPMCGMCARMVTAPRPRVTVPVQPFRPAVPVPVASGNAPLPVAATRAAVPVAVPAAASHRPRQHRPRQCGPPRRHRAPGPLSPLPSRPPGCSATRAPNADDPTGRSAAPRGRNRSMGRPAGGGSGGSSFSRRPDLR